MPDFTFPPFLDDEQADAPAETVLLLHGQGRTSLSMWPLARRLAQLGYRTAAWDYPSSRRTVPEHGEWLRQQLKEVAARREVASIHLVTHSLGGIVAREALLKERPEKLGRVVMLAPPNQGSVAARRWKPLLGSVFKSLDQLTDEPESYVNQLGTPEGVDIGVIAAQRDGKVEVEHTHLNGQTDHVVVPGFHTFIMLRQDVFEHTAHFLENGGF